MKSGPQFVSGVINSLQKRYGSPVDYYQPLSKTTNLATGTQSTSYVSFTIERSLLLPLKISRGFLYDTAFLAAGNGDAKNLSFGALHDKDDSSLVVRARTFGAIKPKMGDHIAWHTLRFDVKNVEIFPDIQIYVLSVARTQSCKDFYLRQQHVLSLNTSGVLA